MTTYSDFVSLLLAFFIMMFAFSNINAEKFRAIMSALQGAFGVLDSGSSLSPDVGLAGGVAPQSDLMPITRWQIEDTQAIFERLMTFRSESELASAFSLELTERGVVIHFTDRVLFDLGQAELRPEAHDVLRAVSEELKRWPNHILVEGHTDNIPIRTSQYSSNWELSTARATTVLRYLLDLGGHDPSRFSAAGYSEYRPIAPNDTEEGQAKNRRVDIVILHRGLELYQPLAFFE